MKGGQVSLREHLQTEQVLICRFSRTESIRIIPGVDSAMSGLSKVDYCAENAAGKRWV